MVGKKSSRRRSKHARWAAWIVVALAVLWLFVVWSPVLVAERAAAGELGSWYWFFDVCASVASQSTLVLGVVVVLARLMKQRAQAVVLGAVLVGVVMLPLSEPRLQRAARTDSGFSIVVYNANTASGMIEAKDELLRQSGADIAVLLELPTALVRSYIVREGMRQTHPYAPLPQAPWSGYPVVLSSYEVDPHESELGNRLRGVRRTLWDHHYRLEIVHTPNGAVAVVQMHARSPRHPERWRVGLDQLLVVADVVKDIRDITGLPIVVAGDFNSTPTGVRARAFADRSGLVRAKPAMKLGGSIPSVLPAWSSLAIDGVYASPEVSLLSWRAIGSAGSDHRAVVVDLLLRQD